MEANEDSEKLSHIDLGSSTHHDNSNYNADQNNIPPIPIGTKRWEHERAKWISGCHQTTKLQQQQGRSCETPSLTVTRDLTRDDSNKMKAKSNANIEEVVSMLFSNRWDNTAGGNNTTASNRFPNPVPLPLMVEILVDVWEAEGLDM